MNGLSGQLCELQVQKDWPLRCLGGQWVEVLERSFYTRFDVSNLRCKNMGFRLV